MHRLEPQPARLWMRETMMGFWSWTQSGDVVLMSAELELAAFTTTGEALWSRFVEPPWTFRVEHGILHLDIMDERSSFDLVRGPERP